MRKLQNPFHELYVTETIDPNNFPGVFSSQIVADTIPLFQPGNVVLMGTQGSGKSMLLALLKPDVRIAYAHAQQEFPVPSDFRRFIGAGINLIRSGANEFGQRPIESDPSNDIERLPFYFADFLNYWIVRDLLSSVDRLQKCDEVRVDLGLVTNKRKLDEFARQLCKDSCWSEYLSKVRSYDDLQKALVERISIYRNFLNFNIENLPDNVRETKTSSGAPISATVSALWESGLVPETVSFFIKIDQFEDLERLEDWSGEKHLSDNYRAVVHKMIGTRDPRVSYRIGTRRYAWNEAPRMHGTKAVIEELRNYKIVDLDELFRRGEHRSGMFDRFAEDVFLRRVQSAGYEPNAVHQGLLGQVFGDSVSAEKKANHYVKKGASKIVRIESIWPDEVQRCLHRLADENVLSAKLGEAWVRQQIVKAKPVLPRDSWYPWEMQEKKYWKKERVQQALMQIAAQQRQKMIWYGKKDIIDLSGGNILVFISICQFIWGAWLRSISKERENTDTALPKIDNVYLQDEGIQQASTYWYRKIRADPDGDSRWKFVSYLGQMLRDSLLKDERMSYPGHNGFSVSVKELGRDDQVRVFLEDAADFGILLDRKHTPKTRSQGPRIKWYLKSILLPYFQIFVPHTKEPMYVHVATVRSWLERANVLTMTSVDSEPSAPKGRKNKKSLKLDSSSQSNLFDY